MPIHLRWELYSVVYGTNRFCGGSYYGQLNRRTKPKNKNLITELKFMVIELFFFRMYYRLNRRYWYWVYPFHMGIFLLVGWLILLLAGALVSLRNIDVTATSSNIWGSLIYYLSLISGLAGLVIVGLGVIGLFVKRVTDKDLKKYTDPLDYFNLLLILAIIISGLAAWGFYDREFTTAREFVRSIATLSPLININPGTYVNVLLICIFLIHSPFTRMSHYIAKYYNYHRVQWDDTPNMGIDRRRKQINTLLNQIPEWSGSHIYPHKNWGQLSRYIDIDKSESDKQ